MSNSIYFLRHAETKVDKTKPAREWNLTKAGIRETKELAISDTFEKIDCVVYSSEKKAIRTAKILSKAMGVQMYELSELDELRRENEIFLTTEEYRSGVRETLLDWEHSVPSWESAQSALQRMLGGIRHINIMFYDNNVIAVSHGIVLSILFSHLRGLESIAFERWSRLAFLSWGLVRENKVLVDLI